MNRHCNSNHNRCRQKNSVTSGPTEDTNEEEANSCLSEPWKCLAIGGVRYQAESEGLIKGLYNDTMRPKSHLM